jgi:tocopherol O-methyltransferase
MNDVANTAAIRSHYDRLSILYWWFWGEHIHHGFWKNGESPRQAQLNLVQELAARARIPRGARVLDVGCGLGGSSFWLARHFDCSVLGITISPVQKQIAEKRAFALGLSDRVRFVLKDANQLDFAARSFDVIWNIECSEHLADKARFIQECARLLRPGGVIALCAWLVSEPMSGSRNNELLAKICSAMLCPSLATLSDYKHWLSKSGFEKISAADVTPQVEKTWQILQDILRRPLVRAFLPLMRLHTREFTGQFAAIQLVYREGVMRYGIFSARKQ